MLLLNSQPAAVSTATAALTIPAWTIVDSGYSNSAWGLARFDGSHFFDILNMSLGVLSGGVVTWYAQTHPSGTYTQQSGWTILDATHILCTGGGDIDDTAATAQCWVGTLSGTTISWASAGSLSATRAKHTAIRLSDGRVMVNGGYDFGYNTPLDDTDFITLTSYSVTGVANYTVGSGSYALGLNQAQPVVLSDGRLLIATGAGTGGNVGLRLLTISGNTFSAVDVLADWTGLSGIWQGPYGFGIHKLTNGRVIAAGGYYDTTGEYTWASNPDVREFTISGDTITTSVALDNVPYTPPSVTVASYLYEGAANQSIYFAADSGSQWYARSLPSSSAAAALAAAPTSQPSVVAGLTTTPLWANLGGAGEYPAYGILRFDANNFYDIYQRKLGVLVAGVMTWYTTNVPSSTYGGGHGFCILDSTHIFCSGGTDSGFTVGTNQCWVGTLSGTTITWASAGTLPETRCFHSATKLADGRILINGGYDYGQVTQRFNSCFLTLTSYSITGTFVYTGATELYISKLPVLLPDDRVLWVNGQNGTNQVGFSFLTISGNTYTKEDVFLSYNFGSYSGIYHPALIQQTSGRILFGGGSWNDASVYPPVSEIYELTVSNSVITKSASSVASVPVTETGSTASYFSEGPSNNTIYISGGTTYGQFMRIIPDVLGVAAFRGALKTHGNTGAQLTTSIKLASVVSATNTFSVALKTGAGLSASPSATAAANAAMFVNVLGAALVGAPTTISNTGAQLTTSIKLASVVSARNIFSVALNTTVGFTATPSASASANAALTTSLRLLASSFVSPSYSALLTAKIKLNSSPSSFTTTSAAMSTQIKLKSSVSSFATTSPKLKAQITLVTYLYSTTAVSARIGSTVTPVPAVDSMFIISSPKTHRVFIQL